MNKAEYKITQITMILMPTYIEYSIWDLQNIDGGYSLHHFGFFPKFLQLVNITFGPEMY